MTAALALVTAPLLAVIAFNDLRHHRIRNRDLTALAAVTTGVLGAAAVSSGAAVLTRAALGAGLAALPLVAAWIAQPANMGGGDVKLAALLGASLGRLDPRLGVAAVGGALVVAVVAARKGPAPLAPALVAAALVAAIVFVAVE